jgi:hypothetical protein
VNEALLAGFAFNDLNAATDSRIEAASDAGSFDRALGVDDRRADKGFFHDAPDAIVATAADVPR